MHRHENAVPRGMLARTGTPNGLADHLWLLEPPRYQPNRLTTTRRLAEGSVVVVPVGAVAEVSRHADLAFKEVVSAFPSSTVMVASHPAADRIARALLSAVPGWRHLPVLQRPIACVDRLVLQQALATTPNLEGLVLRWLIAQRPRAERIGDLIMAVLGCRKEDVLTNVVRTAGYPHRTASRQVRATGLSSLADLRRLSRGVRYAAALQSPTAPSVEAVAVGEGYGCGSVVSHLLRDRFRTGVDEVRQKLGWTWMAYRWLGRDGARRGPRLLPPGC